MGAGQPDRADRARGRAAGMVPSRIEGGSAGAEERSATAAGSVAAEAPGLGTKSRRRRRRREEGRRDKRRHTTLEWGEPRKGEERKRQRQEGPREVVNEDAAANELGYRALERAMKESQIHESTRSKVREFMKDPEIVELKNLLPNQPLVLNQPLAYRSWFQVDVVKLPALKASLALSILDGKHWNLLCSTFFSLGKLRHMVNCTTWWAAHIVFSLQTNIGAVSIAFSDSKHAQLACTHSCIEPWAKMLSRI